MEKNNDDGVIEYVEHIQSNKTYTREWYEECYSEYRNDYTRNFDTRNKYLLLSIGGALITLINILDKFDSMFKDLRWLEIFLWIEIGILMLMALFVIYGLFKEIEVSEEYMMIYNNIYEKYGGEKITEQNRNDVKKMLDECKSYKEYLSNEKKLKKFFKMGIMYTIFFLIILILGKIYLYLVEFNILNS